MNNDNLKNLLKQADANAQSAGVNIDSQLSNRIPIIAKRQRTIRINTSIVAVVLISLWSFTAWQGGDDEVAPNSDRRQVDIQAQPKDEIATLQAEIAALRMQNEYHQHVVAGLMNSETYTGKLAQYQAMLDRPDPLEEVKHTVDIAAKTIVRHARFLEKQGSDIQCVINEYEKVIELFPQSIWAEAARQKLTKLII